MSEYLFIPEERGNHRISLRTAEDQHVIVFEHKENAHPQVEVHLGHLRTAYEGLCNGDGSFREALYLSLSRTYLPLTPQSDHHEMARQLRANHTYTIHRTVDDDDD